MRDQAAASGNMYPDLTAEFSSPETAAAMQPPLMQLLQALGLVPPGAGFSQEAPTTAGTGPDAAARQANANDPSAQPSAPPPPPQPAQSSPPPPAEASAPPPPASTPAGGAYEATGLGGAASEPRRASSPQQHQYCQNCRQTGNWWDNQAGSNWNAYPNGFNYQMPWSWSAWLQPPTAATAQPTRCSYGQNRSNVNACNISKFLTNLGQALKHVFVTSTRVSTLLVMLVLIHVLTPVSLLQNVVFFLLASGLGLHMPTLVAGQLLWAAVACLRLFEPFFLAGLLVFAGHKIFVRREPLLDADYWTTRFGHFRTTFAQN